MNNLVWQLQPVDFLTALEAQTRIWRKSMGTMSAGHRRHVRNLRRSWIRQYKTRSGNQDLPVKPVATALSETWETGARTDPKLVIPPAKSTGSRKPRRMRHDLRTLLHASFADKENFSIDLVNAANSQNRRLPSLGHKYEDSRLKLRGVYLEALGAAILPDLQPNDIRRLESQGATVLSNTELVFELPPMEAPADGGESFWHRQSLPQGLDGQPLFTGKGASIGVLDTGTDADHPEFFGKVIPFCAFDQVGLPIPASAPKDFHHHGTHVSGICAGMNAGIAPNAHLSVAAVLMPAGDKGKVSGTLLQIVAGFNWLARSAGPQGDGVDIINASLGFKNMSSDEAQGLYHLLQNIRDDEGTLIVAAVGNDGKNGRGHHGAPARFSNVIAVGAIDHRHHIADFSDWGESVSFPFSASGAKPNLVAPGVSINSCVPKGRYARKSGTSMASPIVSAAAALLIEADGTLRRDPDRLTQRLLALTSHYSHWGTMDLPRVGEGHLDLAKLR